LSRQLLVSSYNLDLLVVTFGASPKHFLRKERFSLLKRDFVLRAYGDN
jgi:hypothetical protein